MDIATLENFEGGLVYATPANGAPEVKAEKGSILHVGTTVRTDSSATADLRFQDGSVVRMANSTRYQIMEISQQEGVWFWAFRLYTGAVRALVKSAEKKGFIKFKIDTRTGTVGVRGTEFIVNYSEASGETILETLTGTVAFGSAGVDLYKEEGVQLVHAGERSSITPKMAIPAEPQHVGAAPNPAPARVLGGSGGKAIGGDPVSSAKPTPKSVLPKTDSALPGELVQKTNESVNNMAAPESSAPGGISMMANSKETVAGSASTSASTSSSGTVAPAGSSADKNLVSHANTDLSGVSGVAAGPAAAAQVQNPPTATVAAVPDAQVAISTTVPQLPSAVPALSAPSLVAPSVDPTAAYSVTNHGQALSAPSPDQSKRNTPSGSGVVSAPAGDQSMDSSVAKLVDSGFAPVPPQVAITQASPAPQSSPIPQAASANTGPIAVSTSTSAAAAVPIATSTQPSAVNANRSPAGESSPAVNSVNAPNVAPSSGSSSAAPTVSTKSNSSGTSNLSQCGLDKNCTSQQIGKMNTDLEQISKAADDQQKQGYAPLSAEPQIQAPTNAPASDGDRATASESVAVEVTESKAKGKKTDDDNDGSYKICMPNKPCKTYYNDKKSKD